MDQRKIIAAVIGGVILIVGLALYSPMVKGVDALYRQFVPHCLVNGETTVKLNFEDAGIVDLTGTSTGTCSASGLSATSGDDDSATTESGTTLLFSADATSDTVSGGKWVPVSSTLETFGEINKLLLSLTPMLIVTVFLASAFGGLFQYGGGTGSLQSAIQAEVLVLVGSLVAIYVAPTIFKFITDAGGIVDDGTVSVTGTFGGITELLLGVMPIGIVIGIIGMATMRGYQRVRSFQNSM